MEKYGLIKYPNYKYTADAYPESVFGMERYMKKQPIIPLLFYNMD